MNTAKAQEERFNILKLIDYTFLPDEHQTNAFNAFIATAKTTSSASLCVYPTQLATLKQMLPHHRLTTVANFPSGERSIEETLKLIAQALTDGANEIDVVLPYKKYLAGNEEYSLDYISQCRHAVPKEKILKVIIESGAIKDTTIITKLCRQLIALNVNFIKTSTGKIATGARISDVHAILETIKNTNVGIKCSGGIRSIDDATLFIKAAELAFNTNALTAKQFRIGASQLVDKLLDKEKCA